MSRQASRSNPRGGSPPKTERAGWGRRTRLLAALSAVAALAVCTLAACALFVPGFVLGAESPATTSEVPVSPPDAGATRESASLGSLLVTLPWGSSEGSVGLAAPGEGLVRGPEALAVASDGRIAILDSVNSRVVILDQAGIVKDTVPLALAEPRFLAVDDNHVCVLDCDADRKLIVFDWNGANQTTTNLPILEDVVTALFLTGSGPCVEVAHDEVFLLAANDGAVDGGAKSIRRLAGRPMGPDLGRLAKVTYSPGMNTRVRLFSMDPKGVRTSQIREAAPTLAPGRKVEHLISVDSDDSGGLIVGARTTATAEEKSGQTLLELTRLVPESATARQSGAANAPLVILDERLLLPESSFAYLGQPYVVAPNGRIYQPIAAESGYSILVYVFAGSASTDLGQVER